MKRHLSIVVIAIGVFVFFMAQAEANDIGAVFVKPSLTTMISNRCISMMDAVSRIPVYIRLFLDVPVFDFRLQGVGYRYIENIKQLGQSV